MYVHGDDRGMLCIIVSMIEGNFPCSTIFLGGLPKMEVSPSLVGGRLVVEDVDVGKLTGSRRRCCPRDTGRELHGETLGRLALTQS